MIVYACTCMFWYGAVCVFVCAHTSSLLSHNITIERYCGDVVAVSIWGGYNQ